VEAVLRNDTVPREIHEEKVEIAESAHYLSDGRGDGFLRSFFVIRLRT
jgi:hypothetical protein